MKIHYLQHVPFENLGYIESFLKNKGHTISATPLYKEMTFPEISEFDILIIMGGPMGINDEAEYPWLASEKEWIKTVIDANKIVLGICLGAQLIASVLGAKVMANPVREIGWFNITKSDEITKTCLAEAMPAEFEAFHWHGDTFEIPQGAQALGYSAACQNQGFILNDRVFAFQFHLETTFESASALIQHCADDLDHSNHVQSASQMLQDKTKFIKINKVMSAILSVLIQQSG